MTPDADDPMTILMAKLTGSNLTKPRLPIAYNLWGKAHNNLINPKFEAARAGVKHRDWMQLHTRITRDLFNSLDKETQNRWKATAKKEHEEATAAWEAVLKGPASTRPEDRQK